MKKRKHKIDVEKAIYLVGQDLSYGEIGRMLADERGRSMPFLGASVCRAVNLRLKLK